MAIRSRRSKFRTIMALRRPILLALMLVVVVYIMFQWTPTTDEEEAHSRESDRTDIFEHFAGRDTCGFGSMDLHMPFDPLCNSSDAVLQAMSDGGRGGFDAPYIPRGCDLKFYTTREICRIMSRYQGIVIYGDSLMRHLTSAFAMLLRQNIDNGGQQQWMSDEEDSCHCDGQTQLFFCHKKDVRDLQMVYENDPYSVACPFMERPSIKFRSTTTWPLDDGELNASISETISSMKPGRPYAFIFGHGLWNEMRQYESIAWIDQVQSRIMDLRPYYKEPGIFWPRVFVTPNAAGENKQEGFEMTQGNKAIIRFEKFMRDHTEDRKLDFFGTYNMSVQGTIPDGTHSGIRINILKAMTLINWLDMQDHSAWHNPTPSPDDERDNIGNLITSDGETLEDTLPEVSSLAPDEPLPTYQPAKVPEPYKEPEEKAPPNEDEKKAPAPVEDQVLLQEPDIFEEGEIIIEEIPYEYVVPID